MIDYQNTSGLSAAKANPPMIAFWSRNDNASQCLHYSLDRGRTWKPYDKNPFLVFPERDPKVFWYEPGKHWVMILYGAEQYHIFTSSNLLDWKDEKNPIPNSFECPDFFELPIDGDLSKKKWVLIQGNGNYSIGTFDGKKFTEKGGRLPCDVGPNFYATQSWHNVETGDGRRIQTAWMRGSEFPEMPFSQQISFPCELTLRTTPAGLRLFREPIDAISKLFEHTESVDSATLKEGSEVSLATQGEAFHIEGDLEMTPGSRLQLDVRGNLVAITPTSLESGHEPASPQGPITHVEFLIDRGSIETYVNRGEISSTRFIQPNKDGIRLRVEAGEVRIKNWKVSRLMGIWK